MNRQLELLSPAGNWDALVAAVQNGADAVYMGGTKFNARRLTDNFDDSQLKKAVEYAHLYGVKVYITVNILIKENELEEMKAFLPLLEECCVDGVIVQDLGVAAIIAEHHPRLALHASTQMTIHQLEGFQIMEKMGFERVVPARELTLSELKYIKDNSNLRIETFIHGALCVSYSGQCLMSSFIGGRSGNRGMCAQPCRLPYILNKHLNKDSEATYEICLKDLSSIDFLDDIIKAGVTSFKIEGRMKRPEYVAIVTREYRKALDSIEEKGYYQPDEEDKRELLQIFNRGGFSSGYYYGTNHDDLFSRERPNHWGVFIGTVAKSKSNTIWITLNEDLNIGDSIEFRLKGSGTGQAVSSILFNGRSVQKGEKGQTVAVKSNLDVKPGTFVYKTSSASQLEAANATYSDIFNRKIYISAFAEFKIGKKPILALEDRDGNKISVEGDYIIQEAVNKAVNRDDIIRQLGKLGDTPFSVESFTIDCDEGIFLPLSAINLLRRKASEALINKRISHFNMMAADVPERNFILQQGQVYKEASKPLLCGYIDNLSVDNDTIKNLDIITYSPNSFSFNIDQLKEQVDKCRHMNKCLRLSLPRITRQADMDLLRSLPKDFWTLFDEYQVGNIGQIKLLQDMGLSNITGDYSLNVTNSISAALLQNLGLKGIVLSPELTTGEIHDIIRKSSLPCEILVYGRLALMTLEYCPHASKGFKCDNCRYTGHNILTDRKGYSFPLIKRRIARCYTELRNSQPIFLADDMGPIEKLTAAVWGLKLEGMDQEEMRDITAIYRYCLDHMGERLPGDLCNKIEAIKKQGFTKGHFFRKVQ